MRFFYSTLACFLHLCLSGCMDYMKAEEGAVMRFAPSIDAQYLNPLPRSVDVISVGKNCKGQIFKIPPISDRNRNDRLYYLWFIDNKLAWPQSVIEPESRQDAIITLTVDGQFLLSVFPGKLRPDFFSRQHVIDFYVSDIEYKMPESRKTKYATVNEKEHSDYVYWIVTFSNEDC